MERSIVEAKARLRDALRWGGRSIVGYSLILTAILVPACASLAQKYAELDERTVSVGGVDYRVSYEPYMPLHFNEDQASEVVKFANDGTPRLGSVSDVYVPMVKVARKDRAPMEYAERDKTLALATGYCKDRNLSTSPSDQTGVLERKQVLFLKDEWWFYGFCALPPNARPMITS